MVEFANGSRKLIHATRFFCPVVRVGRCSSGIFGSEFAGSWPPIAIDILVGPSLVGVGYCASFFLLER